MTIKMLKNNRNGLTIAVAVVLLFAASSWGVWGHQHINKAAVFALPDSLRVFFYNHIDFMTEESVVPDIRKYTYNFKSEGPHHFIDLENFDKPIDSLALVKPGEANKVFEESFLQKNGSLPWYIQEIMEKLTTAMKKKHKTDILVLSADLGHYLGDAHMPLHTSANYDGQMTAQNGVHAFFESQLPEMFGDNYNFYTGDAHYIGDIPKATWDIIKATHNLVDTMLATERNLSANLSREQIWKMEDGKLVKNEFNQPVHTAEYAKMYHEALHGMVEKQIRLSISSTADFWYTAWVNAGKPDLTDLDDPELTAQNKENLAKDYAAWKKGKLTKLKTVNEFK